MNNVTYAVAVQGNVSECHSTIYRFSDDLKCKESITRVFKLQALRGHPLPPFRRRYVDLNERILRIVDNFLNMAPIL